jgi:hypothetical protein
MGRLLEWIKRHFKNDVSVSINDVSVSITGPSDDELRSQAAQYYADNKEEINAKRKAARKKPVKFDITGERQLLNEYRSKLTAMDRHFLLINIQDFYYKYRELSDEYVDRCIHFCEEDIKLLPLLQKEYEDSEKAHLNLMYANELMTKSEYNKRVKSIGRFPGNIPAFKRLEIIYRKRNDKSSADRIKDAANKYSRAKNQ